MQPSGTSADTYGSTLPSGGYTDYGTVSAPATYPGSTAIASADALHYPSQSYIAVGDRKLSFQDATAEDGGTLPSLMDLDGETLPLVVGPRPGHGGGFRLRGRLRQGGFGSPGPADLYGKSRQRCRPPARWPVSSPTTSPGPSIPPWRAPSPVPPSPRRDGDYLHALAEEGPVSLTFRDETYSAVYASQPTVSDFSSLGALPPTCGCCPP